MKQLDMFTGQQLRDEGMQRAADHADDVNPSWTDQAYAMLLKYVADEREPKEFQAEDVRAYAERYGFPEAPSARAWGGVIVRASKAGVIRLVGYKKVSNPNAHCTPAAVWRCG